jgi:oxygen-independent coproporphyrinogen-3 oxidase
MHIFSTYDVSADTIYIGGGTPSVLTPNEIGEILDSVHHHFSICPDVEITLEANPGTISARSLSDYRRCGVNRINIGVQSFSDHNLRFLKRIHRADDAVAAIVGAREAGFDNIGADLIYGIPGQTPADWRYDLQRCIELGPEHISCYMLTYETGTPLTQDLKQKRFKALGQELVAELFRATVECLCRNGYAQYEISNFARSVTAKDGRYRSRHNQKYWTFAPYLGFGPSAHSFMEPVRYWNRRSVKKYINRLEAGKLALEDSEVLTTEQQLIETIYFGFRTLEGISLDRFNRKFNLDFLGTFGSVVKEFEEKRLLQVEKDRCFLTSAGMLFLDSIADRIISANPEKG